MAAVFVFALVAIPPLAASAQEQALPPAAATPAQPAVRDHAPHPQMRLDTDGVLQPGEYVIISPNGSITRARCPYTCRMRGLPSEHCRQWQSRQDPTLCYVQDTRIPSQAIPLGPQ